MLQGQEQSAEASVEGSGQHDPSMPEVRSEASENDRKDGKDGSQVWREMKIELDLPEWTEERHIRIFAGLEEVARKLHGKPLEIKVARCSQCGECCKLDECPHLVYSEGHKGFLCKPEGSVYRRPFTCASGDNAGQPHCSIRWEKVNGSE